MDAEHGPFGIRAPDPHTCSMSSWTTDGVGGLPDRREVSGGLPWSSAAAHAAAASGASAPRSCRSLIASVDWYSARKFEASTTVTWQVVCNRDPRGGSSRLQGAKVAFRSYFAHHRLKAEALHERPALRLGLLEHGA